MRAASIVLLLVFTTVASVDGFYFHIYKYRLYARPASRKEHLLHTVNSVLFPFTLIPIYLARATGLWVWLAVAAVAITLAIETWDIFIENASRADLGGLTSAEYWMHFMMGSLRWGYGALAFASVPASAWFAPTGWSWTVPTLAQPFELLTWGIALVGFPVALLHILLALRGRPRRMAEGMLLMGRVAVS